MEDKVKEWLEKRSRDFLEEWKQMIKDSLTHCKSPLEKLFLIEWRYRKAFYCDYENFFIKLQYEINNYMVDFMVYFRKDGYHHKEKSLIVELDSYLWHGADPEQFAKEKRRERELQKEGYNLMRFSGREIYRNVEKCVEEVLNFLSDIETKVLLKEIEEYEKSKGK